MHNDHLISRSPIAVTIRALLFGPVLLMFVYAVIHWSEIKTLCEGTGDYSLTLLEIEKASRFEALTGPYSRIRARHPAPSAFYLLAAITDTFGLVGSARGVASIAQLLTNSLLLCVATAALVRVRGQIFHALVALYLFIALFMALRPEGLHDIWGPSQVVIPVFCFLCTAPLIIHGKLGWSFWFVVSAVLALSSHIGTSSIVAPVLLLCALEFARNTTARRGFSVLAKLSIAAAALCVIVALVPPVVDALSNKGGNLRRLAAFFIGSSSGQGFSNLFHAPAFLGSFISGPLGLPGWVGVLTLLALTAVAARQHIRQPSPYRIDTIVWLTALLGALLGAAGIRGPQYQYLMLPVCAIVPLLVVLCIGEGGVVQGLLQTSSLRRSALTIALCLAGSLSLSSRWKTTQANDCVDSIEPFIAHFAISKTQPLELRPVGTESWQALASSVYRLYRDGYSVCVPARWGFMVGRELSCRSEESSETTKRRRFNIVDLSNRPSALQPEVFVVGSMGWHLKEKELMEGSN